MQIAQAVSDTDYTQALVEIRHLIEAEPDRGTPDWDRLEALTLLAEAYEANRYAEDITDIERR